jgi:predicted DNA-binding ribbon-helix-helix protein
LSKKENTVTRSFRVSESAFKALEEDAARRNVSLNTLVNQLLIEHTNWGRFLDKTGAIRISKSAFIRLLNGSADEAISEAARLSGLDHPRAVILAKHGVLSLKTVLDYIRNAAAYGGYAEYSEIENQGKLIITITHDLGRKGSIYLNSFLQSMFETIGLHPKISSTEHAVLIEI